jgi:catechol-2,3-dioxygenase
MVAPAKFAHVVYNTRRFDEMIAWYLEVFEGWVQHRDDRLCFVTYDDEHHRFAFVDLGSEESDPARQPRTGVGVNHVAYTWRSIDEFIDLYERLRSVGIVPEWAVRHGPTLSMYYADPDGNRMEFQIDLLPVAEANEFMMGSAFAANPIGEDFDPDALLSAHRAGEPIDDLIIRSDQKPLTSS